MLFPWVGLLEQIRLADVIVHYDDVQFSKGSFVNRVQIKCPEGVKWLTVPVSNLKFGQKIDELSIDDTKNWRRAHEDMFHRALGGASNYHHVSRIISDVYSTDNKSLARLVRHSFLSLIQYFGLDKGRMFVSTQELVSKKGSGSQRVLDIVRELGGKRYITGHGARNYLDHQLFERHGIDVEYMNYERAPYPQQFGAFTPYVSSLDLIANCGHTGADYIVSGSKNWREFLDESK